MSPGPLLSVPLTISNPELYLKLGSLSIFSEAYGYQKHFSFAQKCRFQDTEDEHAQVTTFGSIVASLISDRREAACVQQDLLSQAFITELKVYTLSSTDQVVT